MLATQGQPAPDFIPAAYSPRFLYYFTKFVRRMFRKSFHAVRILPEHADALAQFSAAPKLDRPLLVLVSHTAWWDPLVSLVLHSRYTPDRYPMAVMESSQLRKFGIFKKIGIFGIDPEDPRSLKAMGEYVGERFAKNPQSSFWLTPQGRFTDVRSPIEIRPGAAAIAARTPNVAVLCLAIEYAFWTDQKPEVFLSFRPVTPALGRENSTAAWHRAILETMAENNRLLAAAVTSRDPAKFLPVFDSNPQSGTNWWYDTWLRIRGRSARVEDRYFAPDSAPSPSSGSTLSDSP